MTTDKRWIDSEVSTPQDQYKENKRVNEALTELPAPYISGMKLRADVVLGDLVLNTVDSDGVIWVCTDIEGWWGHPDLDMPDIPRGNSDGSYDIRGRWQARQLTLSGSILVPGPEYSAAARDKLIRATTLVYSGTWLRTYEDPVRASWVRLSGKPDVKIVNARGRIDFSIGLRAPDPVKYEWDDSDPEGYSIVEIPCRNASTGRTGQGTVTNIGSADVTCILEVSGGLTGVSSITNSTRDELLLIIDSVAPGSFLEIDTYDREVALDGSISGTRAIIDTLVDWIQLSPGTNNITFIDEGNPNSTAVLRVYYRSGWIG
jgi:hypothetical protein